MSTYPVLVGERNPYGGDPRYALYDMPKHSAGWRLRHLILGLHRRSYFQCERVNLCEGKWSMRKARTEAAWLSGYRADNVLILLGRKVVTAFGLKDEPPFSVVRRSKGDLHNVFVILPHPSGLCRVWHEPGAIEKARKCVSQACPELPVGEVDA